MQPTCIARHWQVHWCTVEVRLATETLSRPPVAAAPQIAFATNFVDQSTAPLEAATAAAVVAIQDASFGSVLS